jgi:uncharacterized protein DUF4232/putative zinc finger protein
MSAETIPACALRLSAGTLSAWRDGALEPTEARRVEAHVTECVACRTRLAEYDAVATALRAIPEPAPDGGYSRNPRMLVPSAPTTRAARTYFPRASRVRAGGGLGALAAVLLLTFGFAALFSHLGAGGAIAPQTPATAAVSPSGGPLSTAQPSPVASASVSPETSAGPPCRTIELSIQQERSGVALGHVALLFHAVNTTSLTCTLTGYPSVRLVDANRRPLPIQQQRQTSAYTFPEQPIQTVTLARGGAAYFKIELLDVPSQGETCPVAASMEIGPPGDDTSIEIAGPFTVCQGVVITSPFEPAPF